MRKRHSRMANNIFNEVLDRVRAVECAPRRGRRPAGRDRPVAHRGRARPRDPSHGDMATNAAMVLAKDAGKKPRELAQAIAERAGGRRSRAEGRCRGGPALSI